MSFLGARRRLVGTIPLRILSSVALVVFFILLRAPSPDAQSNAGSAKAAKKLTKLKKIDHIIVIYQENWSFDSLYGLFPGARGLADAFDTIPQVDTLGNPIFTLPQPINNNVSPAVPDGRF